MPLFWMVYEIDGKEKRFFIAQAGGSEPALLKASMAGHERRPTEIHELDAKTAKKIPKAMIDRTLSQREAKALLKRLAT